MVKIYNKKTKTYCAQSAGLVAGDLLIGSIAEFEGKRLKNEEFHISYIVHSGEGLRDPRGR